MPMFLLYSILVWGNSCEDFAAKLNMALKSYKDSKDDFEQLINDIKSQDDFDAVKAYEFIYEKSKKKDSQSTEKANNDLQLNETRLIQFKRNVREL